jgi:hypothetical protein
MFDPKKVKVVKQVTVPTLSPKPDAPIYVKMLGAIFVGKEIKSAKKPEEGGVEQKPADLALVVNLETGEEMHLICSAVFKANLQDTYPKDTYVGKAFRVAKLGKRAGKRYFDYAIAEIEI